MLRQWFIDEFVGGEDGIDSPYIDGFCAFTTLDIIEFRANLQTEDQLNILQSCPAS